MKTKNFFWLGVIITLFYIIASASCTFDNEEDLLEDFICDTTDIAYGDLTYIFTDICASCHNASSTERPGIEMDSYQSVVSSINTGLVWPAINHDPGSPNMPFGQPKLSECDLDKINAWINAGMPEN